MKSSSQAVIAICFFFAGILAVGFYSSAYFPARVVIGEASIGTWISGALLIMCSTLCMVMAMQKSVWPWCVLALFFAVLALDERFMFHERLKEQIIFSAATATRWIYELPVMVGALGGAAMAYLLWKNLHKTGRLLLIIAAAMGTLSVLIDIMASGVIWEESLKLIAELVVTCILVQKTGER